MDEKFYYGKPCNHGHIESNGYTIRYKSNKNCVRCQDEKYKALTQTDEGKKKAYIYSLRAVRSRLYNRIELYKDKIVAAEQQLVELNNILGE